MTEENGSTPLFRKEAADYQTYSWLGRPYLSNIFSSTIICLISTTTVMLLILFLVFGQYTHRVSLTGVLVPSAGLINILAPADGLLTLCEAKEGLQVSLGETICTLNIENKKEPQETTLAIAEQIHAKQEKIKSQIQLRKLMGQTEKNALLEQENDLKQQTVQLNLQIDISREYVEQLRKESVNIDVYLSKHLITKSRHDERKDTYTQQRIKLEALNYELLKLVSSMSQLHQKYEILDSQIKKDIVDLNSQLITINQELLANNGHRELPIKAPANGTITAVQALTGQTVQSGSPILTILPDHAFLEAHLMSNSRNIGFVRKGDRVLLRYEAFPYQKFGQYGATVSSVSRAPLQQGGGIEKSLAKSKNQLQDSQYRITALPDQEYIFAYGNKEYLLPGMELSADVFLDSRPLYQWILEPLFSLRVDAPTSSSKPN